MEDSRAVTKLLRDLDNRIEAVLNKRYPLDEEDANLKENDDLLQLSGVWIELRNYLNP